MAACSICGNYHDRLGNRVRCWFIRNMPATAQAAGWYNMEVWGGGLDNHNKIEHWKEMDWYICRITKRTCPTTTTCGECLKGRY